MIKYLIASAPISHYQIYADTEQISKIIYTSYQAHTRYNTNTKNKSVTPVRAHVYLRKNSVSYFAFLSYTKKK